MNSKNALRSPGPVTLDGKNVSRRNALKHGLTAELSVIDGEDPRVFDDMRSALVSECNPQGAIEEALTERLANLLWRLRRLPALESALFAWFQQKHEAMDEAISDDPFTYQGRLHPDELPVSQPSDEPSVRSQITLGRVLNASLSQGDALSKLGRYEVQLMNQTV